jgi:hypothetical protein
MEEDDRQLQEQSEYYWWLHNKEQLEELGE